MRKTFFRHNNKLNKNWNWKYHYWTLDADVCSNTFDNKQFWRKNNNIRNVPFSMVNCDEVTWIWKITKITWILRYRNLNGFVLEMFVLCNTHNLCSKKLKNVKWRNFFESFFFHFIFDWFIYKLYFVKIIFLHNIIY